MSSGASVSHVNPALNVPGFTWKTSSPGLPIPENVVYMYGTLEGSKVYIARVHDAKNIFIGTAIPEKGVCLYLDKKRHLKSSSNYEVLHNEYYHGAMFLDTDTDNLTIDELLERPDLLPAGVDEEGELLYIVQHIDGEHSYYGWISKAGKLAHIPRSSEKSLQVLKSDIGVLTHHTLEGVNICPSCPSPED